MSAHLIDAETGFLKIAAKVLRWWLFNEEIILLHGIIASGFIDNQKSTNRQLSSEAWSHKTLKVKKPLPQ